MKYFYSPFRLDYQPKKTKNCPFCDKEKLSSHSIKDKKGKIIENESYIWLVNWYPRCDGHTMVVPKRHILNLEEETSKEVLLRNELFLKAIKALKKVYPKSGYEIFLQTGEGSDSTVPHLHWHVMSVLESDNLKGISKLGKLVVREKGEKREVLYPVSIIHARGSLQQAFTKVL